MQHYDRVWQEVGTTGTSAIVIIGDAIPTYRTFWEASGLETVEVAYLITDGTGWELGIGDAYVDDLMDPTNTGNLNRRIVLKSTNAGARINIAESADIRVACVPLSMSVFVCTPDGGADLLQGARSVADKVGTVAGGCQAVAEDEGAVAIGQGAKAKAPYSSAFGAWVEAAVAGANTTGDGDAGNGWCHAHTWTGSGASADAAPIDLSHFAGLFQPPANSAIVIEAQIVGRRTAPSLAAYAATIKALVLRDGTSAPTIVGTPVKTSIAVSGGVTADCDIAVSGTAIAISAQGGASGEAWLWAVTIRATEQRAV